MRVLHVPLYLYTDNPIDKDTAHFFEGCLGQIFHVEGFAEDGQLELWVTDEGKQAPNILAHSIWIEPEYVELITDAEHPPA